MPNQSTSSAQPLLTKPANQTNIKAWLCCVTAFLACGGFLAIIINQIVKTGQACQISGTTCDADGQCYPKIHSYICDYNSKVWLFEPSSKVLFNRCGNISQVTAPDSKGVPLEVSVHSVSLYEGPCQQAIQIVGGIDDSPSVTPFRRS